jgi:hypothetical protein
MREIWRVSKNGATVKIWTPHFTAYRSYADITHKYHLTSQSFDYFDRTTMFGKELWLTKEVEFRVKKDNYPLQKGKRDFGIISLKDWQTKTL